MSSNEPRFKIAYVPWWNPLPLAVKNIDKDGTETGHRMVGFVWRQKARLVKNLHHGWMAFAEDQTPEKLRQCPCCGKAIDEEGDK